jgi:uracil-DNA glycosylase
LRKPRSATPARAVGDALEEAVQAAIDAQAGAPMTAAVPDDKPDRDDTCECRPYLFKQWSLAFATHSLNILPSSG